MFEWLTRQLDKIASPTLDWVQVEVTTHCNASCVYCPHTIMKNRWPNRHMSMELFSRLIPFLKYTDLVYLQGWGEPLLNTDFFDMARICKDQGKQVGFTTNGTLLTEETIERLIDLPLDIIGISLAGTTAKTHNRFRKGTDLNKVISSLLLLERMKAKKKLQKPEVHLAYLMLKSNFAELDGIPSLAKSVGAKQVIASNLTFIVDPKLFKEAIFNDTAHGDYYSMALERTRDRTALEDIIFEYHGPQLDHASLSCRENVRHACVVSVEGDVVPCVLTNPVLCGNQAWGDGESAYYTFKDQRLPIRQMSFGNIRHENLTRIWNKETYVQFRQLFIPYSSSKPNDRLPELPPCCLQCYKRLGA
ncbi:MAG: radical SAM/SPASM domain-containing protein [Thermodesulfobacteriota bacterium]|nr:radical SAM/SPASM domain-containing protein [Thermodesulfobacteriota bacterium]